ncbi:uncharacterized protein K452DRAFT_52692 [Aplosporella prunicola CBS 121167]|uniref:BZIP domain-containing protein n=1 Tax=Aplosporella prunicola CBS 121167 TaxID=1176127 RepID=A0A6A6BAD0_9PEZI|nr:uncharacterized protein K452DRAFT_52692 [Aplosporella prunicola CBS 121167]KAF2140204.1 hypothetical protein K452DRAFT_52692 [Aplosporella prunicola CBS 121167]
MMACKKLDIAPAPSPACGHASTTSPFAIPSPQSEGSASPLNAGSPAAPSSAGPSTPIALAPTPGPSAYITPAMSQGPCGNNYVIPPRPKPGRKPATDDPPSKRKQQNREAQRAFRQRKTQKMEETNRDLQIACEARKQESEAHQREVANLNGILAEERVRSEGLKQKVDQLTSDNDNLRRDFAQVQERLLKLERDAELQRRLPPQDQLTPPAWRGELDEPSAISAPTSDSRPDVNVSSGTTSVPQGAITLPPLVRSETSAPKDGCGKCADNGDCPCVDSLVDFGAPARPLPPARDVIKDSQPSRMEPEQNYEEMEMDFTYLSKRPGPSSRPSAMEPPCKPGTCDACMKDPLQKRFCETLARERPFNRSFVTRQASFTSSKGDDEGQHSVKRQRLNGTQSPTIDCGEAYQRFFRNSNLPVDQEHPAWMKELITLPPSKSDAIRLQQLQDQQAQQAREKRHMSAYELDMASVLNVLKAADKRHSTDISASEALRQDSITGNSSGHSSTPSANSSNENDVTSGRNLGEDTAARNEIPG